MPSALRAVPAKKLRVMVAGMVIVPFIFVGGYLALREGSKSEVSGSVELRGGTVEKLTPNRCESGAWGDDAPPAQVQFHGVDLFDAAAGEPRIRVLEDATKGMIVVIRNGDAAPITVNREACTKFEAKVEKTGALVLDRWGLQGSLVLDCPEIAADVRFASCYDGS